MSCRSAPVSNQQAFPSCGAIGLPIKCCDCIYAPSLLVKKAAMTLSLLLNLAVALLACFLLYRMQAAHASFTKRVFTGLGLGVVLGAAFQFMYGAASPEVAQTNAWLDVLGSGYVKLLQMIVIPLIMVSIIGAILKLRDAAALG